MTIVEVFLILFIIDFNTYIAQINMKNTFPQ